MKKKRSLNLATSVAIVLGENLRQTKNSDRYQYILPHYSFDTVLEEKYFEGSISLNSSGSNNLNNSNNLTSEITNNLN